MFAARFIQSCAVLVQELSVHQNIMEHSVVIPSGVLYTRRRASRRRSSHVALSEHVPNEDASGDQDARAGMSIIVERRELVDEQETGPQSWPSPFSLDGSTVSTQRQSIADPGSMLIRPRPSPTAMDFAIVPDHGSMLIRPRPSPTAINFAPNAGQSDDFETGDEKRHNRNTISSIPEEPTVDEGNSPTSPTSRIFRHLSYAARTLVGSPTSNRFSRPPSALIRRSNDDYDIENYPGATSTRKRHSKPVPKSWKFLGIDGPGLGDVVTDAAKKLRSGNARDMYEKAKVRQEQIKRSQIVQSIFIYTFYACLVACIYLVLIGMPLWRGAVWYMYILFKKHMVLKAGLTITFGIALLSVRFLYIYVHGLTMDLRYAYTPLLINFEPTAPKPVPSEATPTNTDTALIIPCYKSAKLIGLTLEAALKIFPKESIFVSVSISG